MEIVNYSDCQDERVGKLILEFLPNEDSCLIVVSSEDEEG